MSCDNLPATVLPEITPASLEPCCAPVEAATVTLGGEVLTYDPASGSWRGASVEVTFDPAGGLPDVRWRAAAPPPP